MIRVCPTLVVAMSLVVACDLPEPTEPDLDPATTTGMDPDPDPDPDPGPGPDTGTETGAATGETEDTGTDTAGDTGGSDTSDMSDTSTSTGDESSTGSPPDCGDADLELIDEAWTTCGESNLVGQSAPAPGVTCEQVCCAFGFSGCLYRTAQQNYDACVPPNPVMSGMCEDEFMPTWNSGCLCDP